MYEMEGPLLAVAALACQLPSRRAPHGYHQPRASAEISGAQVSPVARRFHIPGLPPGRARLSGESISTANSRGRTRPLTSIPVISLAIHRTSAVYPLCAAAFHRVIHMAVHSLGAGAGSPGRSQPPLSLLRGI